MGLGVKMRRYVSGLILVTIFLIINGKVLQLPFLKLADEFLLAVSVSIIVYYMAIDLAYKKISKMFLVLIFYIAYQYINYLRSPFELSFLLVLAQSFINLKVFLVALATILVISKGKCQKKSIEMLFVATMALFIIGLCLNIVLGEEWNRILGRDIGYRYGNLRPIGYFGHPGQIAYYFSLTLVTLLLLFGKKHILSISGIIGRFVIFTLIIISITFPFTVRKGMMMMIPYGYFVFNLISSRYKLVLLIFMVFLTFGLWLLLKDAAIVEDTLGNISNFTKGDHHYIRGLMIFHGFSLFVENFPFGVGGATFGTVLSKYNTLEVYSYVGVPRYFYDTTNELTGVYDSGIASMLAEGGFIGMVIIILFLFYFFKFIKDYLDWYNYQIFKIITGFTIILSLTEPVWQNGLFASFYVVNLLLIYTKNNEFRKSGGWVK